MGAAVFCLVFQGEHFAQNTDMIADFTWLWVSVSGTVVHSIKQLTAASGNANLILWAAMGKCDIFLSKDKGCRCH